ncbi:Uncharacterised protein [Mycobacteroides abscessus subsp. abscessus]|nr:Uncharacterised protein [Mycobacteroides abscessus subsp. abscessus]
MMVSVSFEAIQVYRGESSVPWANRPACTNMYRATPAVDAQPTQEPVFFWLPIFHQGCRRSTLAGSAAGALSAPTSSAS